MHRQDPDGVFCRQKSEGTNMKISKKWVLAVMAVAAAIIPVVAPSNIAQAFRDVLNALGGVV